MYFTYILHVFYVCVWTSIHQARRCELVTQIYDDDLEKEIVAAALQRCIYCSWLKSNVDLIWLDSNCGLVPKRFMRSPENKVNVI